MTKSIVKDQKEQVFSFGKRLRVIDSENVILKLGFDPNPNGWSVKLDFTKCQQVDAGAGWRLGNALRRYKEGNSIEVLLAKYPLDFEGDWFRNFTRSGLGFYFAKYAKRIRTPERDITLKIRDYYFHKRTWYHRNFSIISDLTEATLNPNDELRFAESFQNLLSEMNFRFDLYTKETEYNPLRRLIFESIQNTYDHASRKPLPEGTNISSYVAVGYYQRIHTKTHNEKLNAYLASVSHEFYNDSKYKGIIEILVNDDGVGVASRQSLDTNIYWEDESKEINAVKEALKEGGSVKVTSQDTPTRGDPGMGFSKILSALKEIRAFALIRTGRVNIFFNPDEDKNSFQFSESLGYMPGTTIQVLLPRRIQL